MSMKHKLKTSIVSLFIIIIIFIIIETFSILYQYSKKTIMNTGNVSGNTAGNLYNNGIFCEYNNKVYFSNSYDNGNLYVMNSDGSNIKMLCNDTVSYINVAGKYIYYARNNLSDKNMHAIFRGNLFGVYRINTNGKNILCLNDETCGVVSLGNNTVFYQHYEPESALSLRSISIDGTNEKDLTNDAINPSCIVDGTMYYNNVSGNFNLSTLDVESKITTEIYNDMCWNPIYDDNYVYFMDISNDYSLARVNLSTFQKEVLGTGRVDTYNLYGDYIYYQANDAKNPKLCRMKKDGTKVEDIIYGNFCNINVTSKYVYFNQFGYDNPIYKIETTGNINVSRFDEAADAIKND